jgi:hypothetical protein
MPLTFDADDDLVGYNGERMAVRFMGKSAEGTRVDCYVLRQVLDKMDGTHAQRTATDLIESFKKRRDIFQRLASLKFDTGDVDDGAVIVSSTDDAIPT